MQLEDKAEQIKMPTYGFICNKCSHKFDLYLPISKREEPINKPCPNCSLNESVCRDFNEYSQTIGCDATLTANTATGGRWNELMGRMKKGLAKRHHSNLDIASSQSGRYWRG